MKKRLIGFSVLTGIAALATSPSAAKNYSWQQPHAKILPNGDLAWAPEPYGLEAVGSVYYIDFENGDDANDGTSKTTPWKHHPWDRNATGKAAEASGPATYIFKGGVAYRSQLVADESGEENRKIRLMADPSWGSGKPWFFGSERLPAKWVPAATVQHPDRLPEPNKVWALDLKTAGFALHEGGLSLRSMSGRMQPMDATRLGLYRVRGPGGFQTLHLARTPDWQPMGENFAMDFWHKTDAEVEKTDSEGKRIATGFKDSIWAGKDLPENYFTGGFIWIAWRNLMGTPTPSPIPALVGKDEEKVPYFDPEEGSLMTTRPGGHGKGGLPYMIENLPQFLDAPGEYYLDPKTGLLFVRLADGENPNDAHLELTTDLGTILIETQSHIEIAGLGFAFTQDNTIDLVGGAQDINIHHCDFRNLGDTAIRGDQPLNAKQHHIMDRIRVADCSFEQIDFQAISISGTFEWNDGVAFRGHLEQVDILRNRTFETGGRQRGQIYSNVAAISIKSVQRGEIAGNIVVRSFGSGIVVHGGKSGSTGKPDAKNQNLPLIRLLLHHNKTEDTALGVNDYGGLALWQGGPTYAYCNNVGNSPGHCPAGFLGVTKPTNLSYPLYLDGAFKQYCFNNIIWGRTTDPSDPYANTTPGYFMVFGFLNQFFENTVYRQANGMGGSSGNRNDIVGNIFAEINREFIASNRIGDPSLVGGGDMAGSGLRGIPTLAFARNLFHGTARAGFLVREKEMESAGLKQMIDAQTLPEMAEQMQAFPLRIGELGQYVEKLPIGGAPAGKPINELTVDIDFHPVAGSPAIDSGGTYFVPWSLYGTVGEWNFVENRAAPGVAIDNHWWMSEAHYDRQMYEQIPSFDLAFSKATLADYCKGPSEDWTESAIALNGSRFGRVEDAALRADLRINLGLLDAASKRDAPLPIAPWKVDKPSGKNGHYTMDDYITYPGELRKTLIIKTENLLVEAIVRSDPGTSGTIAAKYDGKSGYGLGINSDGKAEFMLGAQGKQVSAVSIKAINDGQWHHVIAEVDRATQTTRIYLDGKLDTETGIALPPDASIDTRADFIVGKDLKGALDFLRVCRGTLADSKTDIAELYTWEFDGPFRRDFTGAKSADGHRDAGALERN